MANLNPTARGAVGNGTTSVRLKSPEPEQRVGPSAPKASYVAKARSNAPNLGGGKDVHQRDVQVVESRPELKPALGLAKDKVFQNAYEAANDKPFDPRLIVSAFAHVNGAEQHKAPPRSGRTISLEEATKALSDLSGELENVDEKALSPELQRQLQYVKSLCASLIQDLTRRVAPRVISAPQTSISPSRLDEQNFGGIHFDDDSEISDQSGEATDSPEQETITIYNEDVTRNRRELGEHVASLMHSNGRVREDLSEGRFRADSLEETDSVDDTPNSGVGFVSVNRVPPGRQDDLQELLENLNRLERADSEGDASNPRPQVMHSNQRNIPNQLASADDPIPNKVFEEIEDFENAQKAAQNPVNQPSSNSAMFNELDKLIEQLEADCDNKSPSKAGGPIAQVKLQPPAKNERLSLGDHFDDDKLGVELHKVVQVPKQQIMQSNQRTDGIRLDLDHFDLIDGFFEKFETFDNAPEDPIKLKTTPVREKNPPVSKTSIPMKKVRFAETQPLDKTTSPRSFKSKVSNLFTGKNKGEQDVTGATPSVDNSDSVNLDESFVELEESKD